MNPRAHFPVWANVPVEDELVGLFAPWFFPELNLVTSRISEIREGTPSKKVKAKLVAERLYMAEGALKAVHLRVKRAIQLAACRPYSTTGILASNVQPNYLRWKDCALYKMDAFQHPLFLSFVDKMKVAQDMAARYEMVVSGSIKNEVDRVVQERVTNPMQQMQAVMNGLLAQVMSLNQRLMVLQEQQALSLTAPASYTPAAAPEDISRAAAAVSLPEPQTGQNQSNMALNKKGMPRKKAPKTNIIAALPSGALWSSDLKNARDFWVEFAYGLNGRPALQTLEEEQGSQWRSDKMIATISGKPCTALKKGWSTRTPIYNWILHRIEDCHVDEDVAISEVQDVFDQFLSSKNTPKLQDIAKTLRQMLQQSGATPRYGRR